MKPLGWILCGLLFFSGVDLAGGAETKTAGFKVMKEEGPVDIEADMLSFDQETKLYEAHGDVEVKRGAFSLKADHAQVNMETKEVRAWGNVMMREGEDVIECERLEVNLESQSGKVYRAKLFMKEQNYHVTGEEVEKLGENVYRVRRGSFTTCDTDRPPWKFTVSELEVTLTGSGIAKGSVFYLEGIPVLYLPWGIFPVRKERQSGFLIPRPGYSSEYGFQMKNAFYWAINKNMDATVYLDWLGTRGLKEGIEYRYALTQETQGKASFNFIHDQETRTNRYSYFLSHEQKLPSHFYLKADINRVSDPNYVRDFDEDLPSGTKLYSTSLRQLRSLLFGGKNWDQFSLLVQGAVYDDLTKESNDETVQKLPQINFHAHSQSLFNTPLFFEVASSFNHFWREKNYGAYRGDLFPKISFPTRLFNVLKLEANAGVRETLYHPYNDPSGRFGKWISRESFETGAEMSTEFYRVYTPSNSSWFTRLYPVGKWLHAIEPTVSYRFIPRVDQKDNPFFDEVDRIPYTNEITYGITQRLMGRPQNAGATPGPTEYAKLRISQSYSLGDPYRDFKGKERSFSNIETELWLNFGPYVTSYWDLGFNPYQVNFDVFNAAVSLKDKREDYLAVGYRFTRNLLEEVNIDLRIKAIPSLFLFGSIHYDLRNHWRVGNVYGAEYKAQCWGLAFTVEFRNQSPDGTQKREVKYHLFFDLLGVSSIGRKPIFTTY